jgi:hypothetical protein
MIENIKKYKFEKKYLIRFLFNIFPLIILLPSGYITVYIAFFIIYGFIFLFKNKVVIKILICDYLIFIFFILSIISTIINYGNSDHIIIAKSIAGIRFAFLFLLIRNLFHYSIIKINSLLIFSTLCAIFVSLDIVLQFNYGKNILGYPEIDGRYGGIFGKEAIAGSYIQKFSMLAVLTFFYLEFKKKININIILISVTLFIFGVGILMTLDRAPFLIYSFSLLLLLILLKNFRKIISISILLIALFFIISYKNNDLIHNRYKQIFYITSVINSEIINLINKNDKQIDENKHEDLKGKIILRTGIQYFSVYHTAFYVFKNSFWFGSGTKSYLKKCYELKKDQGDLLCAPHPHNLYLEILVNQGVFGFSIFAIFLYFLFKKYFFDLTKLKINQTERLLKIIFLIILISELWPLRSYGSIFQTVNGSIFWFILSLVSSSNKNSLK